MFDLSKYDSFITYFYKNKVTFFSNIVFYNHSLRTHYVPSNKRNYLKHFESKIYNFLKNSFLKTIIFLDIPNPSNAKFYQS